MPNDRISLRRTVLYVEDEDTMCSCTGNFWKTCSLRVKGELPCQEAIVTITPINRTDVDPAKSSTRSIDKSLAKLTDNLRNLENKFKI